MKERQKCISLGWLIVACIIAIGLIGFLLILLWGDKSWFFALVYLIVASAIAGGGCVAYHHLRIIQGTERAEVLTSLDCSWMSNELEESRISLLKFQKEFETIEDTTKRETYIKDKLREIRNSDEVQYRNLVAMINFYETIGYFSRVGYILPNDALELYGPGIRDNDKAFRSHILELQEEKGDKELYANFLWLANNAKLK